MTPSELRDLVAAMRELGVTECDGVKLGPVPGAPTKREPVDEQKAAEQRDAILFAASGVRPR